MSQMANKETSKQLPCISPTAVCMEEWHGRHAWKVLATLTQSPSILYLLANISKSHLETLISILLGLGWRQPRPVLDAECLFQLRVLQSER